MIQQHNLDQILKKALAKGGSFAEIFYEHSFSTALLREAKKTEKVLQGCDQGVGIRVLSEGKTAYAYTHDLTEKGLLQLAEKVSEVLKAKLFHKDFVLHATPPAWKNLIQQDPSTVPLAIKVQKVLDADQFAWALDPRIQQVTVSYRDHQRKIQIANSLGEFCEDFQIYTVFSVQVVAREKDLLQTGYEPIGGTLGFELLEQYPPEQVAQTAALQALRMLQARPSPTGKMPVVLSSEAGGTMVHEAVGHGLEADLALEGLSVYADKIGAQVASALLTVVDDKTLPNKRGSFVFDDEGTPAQRTLLIEKGLLKSYLYDRNYAEKAGTNSTGNGRRESYKHRPIVRMTNTMIAPGQDKPEEIISSVERGLFVKKMGGGQVNTVNGDFMFEVTEAYLLEKGKVGDAVRGATLTGNGPEILKMIDKVGCDLGFGIGTCGKEGQGVPVADAQPTLRIPEIVVGGVS